MASFPSQAAAARWCCSPGMFVAGNPLSKDAVAEIRRGIFAAHLHIPSDNGESFQWSCSWQERGSHARKRPEEA